MTSTGPADAPSFDVTVERGKIREFAAATQSDNPAYQQLDAVVPPTFLIAASFWTPDEARPQHGFDRRRLLHGEQEYIFHGPPPRAGQTLTARTRITDRYEREGKRGGTMRFAVMTTEFTEPSGRLVAEQKATFVETAPRTKEA